jgi:hypothetical protein
MWAESKLQDLVMRVALAVAGLSVGTVLAVRPIWEWKTAPPSANAWALFGIGLIVWTIFGVAKPTLMRYLPPAAVSIPLAVFGIIRMLVTGSIF